MAGIIKTDTHQEKEKSQSPGLKDQPPLVAWPLWGKKINCKMFIGPETVTSLLKPGMYKDGLLSNPCISMTKPVSVAKDSEEF